MAGCQWIILGLFMIQPFSTVYGQDKKEETVLLQQAANEALQLSDIFKNIEIQLLKHKHTSEEQKQKALRIQKLIHKQTNSHECFTEEQILNILKIVDMFQKKKKYMSHSYYLYPDYHYLWLPIQIYRNGHVYLHLEERDSRSKQGGYKYFSRSISLDKEEIVANLEAPVRSKKSYQNLSFEIQAMEQFSEVPGILKLKDYAIFDQLKLGKEGKELQVFVFQTDLYENDIGVFKDLPINYSVLYKMAVNLEAFHSQKWLHRDVKPGNFFYRPMQNLSIETVIADFGLAKKWAEDKTFEKSISGTRGYMDPVICYNRVINDITLESFDDGVKADIFSLGMVYLNLYSKKSSYFKDLVQRINRMALPPKGGERASKEAISQEFEKYRQHHEKIMFQLKDSKNLFEIFVYQMLSPNLGQRPSLQDVKIFFSKIIRTHT